MVKYVLETITKNRIGIFSGSFDPPHLGHIHISKLIINKLKLEKLIWSVTKKNPLFKKKYLNSYKQRIDFSIKITQNIKKILVSKIDKKYSFQLISFFKKKYKNKRLFFLIGGDNVKNFHKWKNFNTIINTSTLVIVSRPGYEKEFKSSFFYKKYSKFLLKNCNMLSIIPAKKWIYINDKGINISSSMIKNVSKEK